MLQERAVSFPSLSGPSLSGPLFSGVQITPTSSKGNIMILYSSPPSPFGRKIKIAASCLGVMNDITVTLANTMDPEDAIRGINPLGKIPALQVDGLTIYDSRVILEFLDSQAGGDKLIPAETSVRFAVLTDAAKIDGILDAAILVVYETRFRPENMRVEKFVEWQRDKIIRGLATLKAASYSNGAMPNVAEIGLACCLDYLDFRQQVDWRDQAPHLVNWLAEFAAVVPGYAETMPSE